MFIIYFALWVIMNGRWTMEIGAFGVVFAALLYAFSCKFMGYSVARDLAFIRSIGGAIRYAALVVREIVKANINVIGMILDLEHEPQPQLVRFESGLPDEISRVTYANSITLTPGTITVLLSEDDYVVHCLDEAMIDGLLDGPMVTALAGMAKKEEKKQ